MTTRFAQAETRSDHASMVMLLASGAHSWRGILERSNRMDYLGLIQWPAMAVTVIAAWFVSSRTKTRRGVGFWCFLASNVLWTLWGWHTDAYALIVLQVCLAAMNIRGARKNEAA